MSKITAKLSFRDGQWFDLEVFEDGDCIIESSMDSLDDVVEDVKGDIEALTVCEEEDVTRWLAAVDEAVEAYKQQYAQ